MGNTAIEWTDKVWNCLRGCSRTSPGCEACYAERIAARFSDPGLAFEGLARRGKNGPRWTGKIQMVVERLVDPLKWTHPRRVFVNSMSDLFHEDLSNEQIAAMFGVMAAAPQHTFQCLTKRAERMAKWFVWVERAATECNNGVGMTIAAFCLAHAQRESRYAPALSRNVDRTMAASWPLSNVWIGVSVEDQQRADERIPHLMRTPAAVRFLSCEPLLGPIKLDLFRFDSGYPAECICGHGHGFTRCPNTGGVAKTCHKCECREFARSPGSWTGVDWVIVGGESGPGARLFKTEWARQIVDDCAKRDVACFVKQMGANVEDWHSTAPVRIRLKSRKGGDMEEWPEDLRVREFPRRKDVQAHAPSAP